MPSTYLTHGNAVTVAERPGGGGLGSGGDLENVDGVAWTDVVGLRRGWGTSFRGQGGKFIWFHLPFPTPTVVNDLPCDLARLDVFFDIDGPASLAIVDLWSYVRDRWFHREGLSSVSDWSTTWSPPVRLHGAIGISLGISFREPANVTFRGAKVELA